MIKWSLLLLLLISRQLASQPLVHAHNDYQKKEPLTNALRNRVFSFEADVWLVNNELRVAHEARELSQAPTLDSLYLQPLVQLFKKYKGHVSRDIHYAPVLMIDIKMNGPEVLQYLQKKLAAYPRVFDRKVNPAAIQVVISGERGNPLEWKNYPSLILFDGRPYENYDSSALHKVAFISDTYLRYATADTFQTREKIKALAQQIHTLHKPLRLWAIPDSPSGWVELTGLGVDIINTDRVQECRAFFYPKKD